MEKRFLHSKYLKSSTFQVLPAVFLTFNGQKMKSQLIKEFLKSICRSHPYTRVSSGTSSCPDQLRKELALREGIVGVCEVSLTACVFVHLWIFAGMKAPLGGRGAGVRMGHPDQGKPAESGSSPHGPCNRIIEDFEPDSDPECASRS